MPACEYRPIFYYVHAHGNGHFSRTKQLLAKSFLLNRVIFLTNDRMMQSRLQAVFPNNTVLLLPPKYRAFPKFNKRTFDSAFEGTPCNKEAGLRAEAFISFINRYLPTLFISDVSAELTILARGAGVRTLMMRHSGNTEVDPTQTFAYACSERLFAPFPRSLEHEGFPFAEKTLYLGFTGKLVASDKQQKSHITVVSNNYEWVTELSNKLSALRFTVDVYGCNGLSTESVFFHGVVDNVVANLRSNVVFCHGGNNILSELLAARKRLVVTPLERPYNEQCFKVRELAEKGYVVALFLDEKLQEAALERAYTSALAIDTERFSELYRTDYSSRFNDMVENLL